MAAAETSSVEARLEQLAVRRPQLIDLSLDRMRRALAKLGEPQDKLPPVFHIAGTNGKGSTGAFLRAILEATGRRVHAYSSPHLVRFNERIVLAGDEIADDHLLEIIDRVDRLIGDEKLTYFEATTCAAFLAFAESDADAAVIEVGLGGRLDATNVFTSPLATIVTPVDFDHQQFLGDTLADIAAEKAGIFRNGAPAVIGRQSSEAMRVLCEKANAAGAPVFAFGQDWDCYLEHGRFVFQDEDGLCDLDPPRLLGAHQVDNAGLAVAAIRRAMPDTDNLEISTGIASAFWPARLQRLTSGPLADRLSAVQPDAELWLDGGHNPHAGVAIARAMADLEARNTRPLILVAGMQANKDARGYFEPFAGLARNVIAVAAARDGVMPKHDVAQAARDAGLDAVIAPTVAAALEQALDHSSPDAPRILICGSLYLAGEVLQENA